MGNNCFKVSRVGVSTKKIMILMVGLDNAGKTCTAKSIVGESLESVAPTVGFSKVDHKYKGYHVTIYDLGGSKSFRGIWPKYYHEVHGFIFVVDSADSARIAECSSVLRAMLDHHQVRGKPILLLANKADVEMAQDEVEVVSQLDIESLVNSAQCPTRVEASVATKNQGLREGYKWLVKSIIANYLDLGERVDRDMEQEQKAEEERRKAVRKRIEERRKKEEEEVQQNGGAGSQSEAFDPPGFVPVETLRSKWASQEKDSSMVVNVSRDSELSSSPEPLVPGVPPPPVQLSARDLRDKLELEPVSGPKKRGLLSKFSRKEGSEVRSLDSRISGDSRESEEDPGQRKGAHTGYRNWGLAEELQPSG